MTKPPAGNSHRHMSHVEMLQEAAMGQLQSECGCVTLSCPHRPDPFNLASALPIETAPATSHCGDSEPVDYQALILAARKRREERYRGSDLAQYADELDRKLWIRLAEGIESDVMSRAMSRPLSFDKRIGWKGVPIG